MASFHSTHVLHQHTHIYCVFLFFSSILLAAASDPYGFDQTKGTQISGREFLFTLSADNPKTGTFVKVHLETNRRTSVIITSYDNSDLPQAGWRRSLLLSPGNSTDIPVLPPRSSWTGSFVVNVTSSQNITLVAMRNGTSQFGSYTVYPTANAGRFYDIVSFPSANEEQLAEVIVIGMEEQLLEITFKSRKNFTLEGEHTGSFRVQNKLVENNTMFIAYGGLRKRQFIIFRSVEDLTASTISAVEGSRVAVITSTFCPTASCDSILTEQMPPIQTLGNNYFLVPAKDYAGVSCFRVLSPWADTTVTTNSLQTIVYDTSYLGMGEYFDIDIPNGSIQNIMSIKGSNPLLIVHYLIKSDEPVKVASMALIPSVEQFTSGNTTFSTYNLTKQGPVIRNFVNIITQCDLTNYVLYDRRSIQSWTTCPPISNGGPTYCAKQLEITSNGKHRLESHSRYPLTEFSAVQYGIRTDKSAFANTVFMGFPEITCNISRDGATIPCDNIKPTASIPTTILPPPTNATSYTAYPTTEQGSVNTTNSKNYASHRQKTGTVLAIVVGIITMIAGTIALIVIANAACGKRSKWKRLHNQGDASITLDSVSV